MAMHSAGPRILRPPSYLSPNEAGVLLGVTGYTIKDHIRRGRIKAVRTANGYYWIKPTDLKGLKFGKPTIKPKPLKPVRRRAISINHKAAEEFGFDVENTKPNRNR